MNKYDVVIGEQFGIVKGKKKLVFIKTGRGGTIYGHGNKYLDLCMELRERYGCSLVVSANPEDSACDLEDEIRQINEHVDNCDEIYYMGISNGALVGAQQCWKNNKIKKALLINGPLMINWYKTKSGAEAFKGEHMRFVYGDRDPSYKYVALLDLIENDACKHIVFKGEGHRFSDSSLKKVIVSFLDERM